MYEGIVSFTTDKADLHDFALGSHIRMLDYPSLQARREFFAPVYPTAEAQASRVPDFRNVMYWAPDIRIAAGETTEVRFYTSDLAGEYAVVVEGLSADGLPACEVRHITVSE